MTVTISIDKDVADAGRMKADALKGKGQRRRYSFSAYIEELIYTDTSGDGLLPVDEDFFLG
tara:strand:- start:1770 stop:1952 length:183 start_codon:yes stop_codon:yes gene_type:complete